MLELLKCSLEPGYTCTCESKGSIINHLGGVVWIFANNIFLLPYEWSFPRLVCNRFLVMLH